MPAIRPLRGALHPDLRPSASPRFVRLAGAQRGGRLARQRRRAAGGAGHRRLRAAGAPGAVGRAAGAGGSKVSPVA